MDTTGESQESPKRKLASLIRNIGDVTTRAGFMEILRLIEELSRQEDEWLASTQAKLLEDPHYKDLDLRQMKIGKSRLIALAKVHWFVYGLRRFNIEFVDPAVQLSADHEPDIQDPDNLTMTWEDINRYMTPEFLGQAEYDRQHEGLWILIQYLVDSTQGKFQQFWEERLGQLPKLPEAA